MYSSSAFDIDSECALPESDRQENECRLCAAVRSLKEGRLGGVEHYRRHVGSDQLVAGSGGFLGLAGLLILDGHPRQHGREEVRRQGFDQHGVDPGTRGCERLLNIQYAKSRLGLT